MNGQLSRHDVTLSNWAEEPYNVWAFQHMAELVPSVRIPGNGRVDDDLSQATDGVCDIQFSSDGRTLSVGEMLTETHTDAFLVLHEGSIVCEHYFNDMGPSTLHLLMSVSKSVTATVAGILVGKGLLDPNATIESILPELAGSSFTGATVRQLLDMRTGTKFDENYDDSDSDIGISDRVYRWRPLDDLVVPPDAHAYFATLHNDGEHGVAFRYRSILIDVLGWVLERASDQPLNQLIASVLWQPLGAGSDAEITVDAAGNPLADGGISACLRDLGRFGLAMAQGGVIDGQTVVPPSWIEDILKGAPDGSKVFAEAYPDSPYYPKGAHYRSGWWVLEPSVPFFQAWGIYGQGIFIHVPTQVVVVKLSSWPTPMNIDLSCRTLDGVRAIVARLGS